MRKCEKVGPIVRETQHLWSAPKPAGSSINHVVWVRVPTLSLFTETTGLDRSVSPPVGVAKATSPAAQVNQLRPEKDRKGRSRSVVF